MTKHFFQIADLPQLYGTDFKTPQAMTNAAFQAQLVSESAPAAKRNALGYWNTHDSTATDQAYRIVPVMLAPLGSTMDGVRPDMPNGVFGICATFDKFDNVIALPDQSYGHIEGISAPAPKLRYCWEIRIVGSGEDVIRFALQVAHWCNANLSGWVLHLATPLGKGFSFKQKGRMGRTVSTGQYLIVHFDSQADLEKFREHWKP